MSNNLTSRLPAIILKIFHAYKDASLRLSELKTGTLKRFAEKSTDQYQTFNLQRLILGSSSSSQFNFNPLDFAPVEAELVKILFSGPLDLEADAEKALQAHLAKYETNLISGREPALISDRDAGIKSLTLYHARILSNFASYYRALRAPHPYEKSLIWYRRLLANTPVIFFLKQKQRLFSEPSLSQYNLSYHKLRDGLRQVQKVYHSDKSMAKRVRNYYCTDLITTDIFDFAVISEHLPEILQSELKNPAFWTSLNASDKLVSHLRMQQKPQLVDLHQLTNSPKSTSELGSVDNLNAATVPARDQQIAPCYDINYNDLYILTIEEAVLGDDHSQLLDLVESIENIEVTAVRIDRIKAATNAIADNAALQDLSRRNGTYEELLKTISKTANSSKDNLLQLYKRLGEWGFINVEENREGTALYLFK